MGCAFLDTVSVSKVLALTELFWDVMLFHTIIHRIGITTHTVFMEVCKAAIYHLSWMFPVPKQPPLNLETELFIAKYLFLS